MKKEYLVCDVCKSEEKVSHINKITVVFTTEQTEGRYVKPYLSEQNLDLCKDCIKMMTEKGRILFGSGAQGYNKYYFKSDTFYHKKIDLD